MSAWFRTLEVKRVRFENAFLKVRVDFHGENFNIYSKLDVDTDSTIGRGQFEGLCGKSDANLIKDFDLEIGCKIFTTTYSAECYDYI